MDITPDPRLGQPGTGASPPAPHASAADAATQPDWHGLVARLSAAQGLWAALDGASGGCDASAGSFAPGVALALAGYADPARAPSRKSDSMGDASEGLFAEVNPIISADGKAGSGMNEQVTGRNIPGAEG